MTTKGSSTQALTKLGLNKIALREVPPGLRPSEAYGELVSHHPAEGGKGTPRDVGLTEGASRSSSCSSAAWWGVSESKGSLGSYNCQTLSYLWLADTG